MSNERFSEVLQARAIQGIVLGPSIGRGPARPALGRVCGAGADQGAAQFAAVAARSATTISTRG